MPNKLTPDDKLAFLKMLLRDAEPDMLLIPFALGGFYLCARRRPAPGGAGLASLLWFLLLAHLGSGIPVIRALERPSASPDLLCWLWRTRFTTGVAGRFMAGREELAVTIRPHGAGVESDGGWRARAGFNAHTARARIHEAPLDHGFQGTDIRKDRAHQ